MIGTFNYRLMFEEDFLCELQRDSDFCVPLFCWDECYNHVAPKKAFQ